MKQRKIVIIRGATTAGKSTISHELAKVLPEWIFIDSWKIKEMFEPLQLQDRSVPNAITKEATLLIIRKVIENLKLNIIVQENTQDFLKKKLHKELQGNKYRIYSFYLNVSYQTAITRDKEREKPTLHLGKRHSSEEMWNSKKPVIHKEDTIIDTSNKSISETVSLILKEIHEKRKKHPFIESLRKSW